MCFDLNGKVLGGGELFWDKKSGLHDSLIKGVDNITPKGGTNLHLAIEALSRLVPKPDRIVLITDGLPGKIANRARLKACPKKSTGVTRLDGECRISIAIKSVEKLGGKLAKVPVDIILLPLEGDSDAVRFYSLIFWYFGRKINIALRGLASKMTNAITNKGSIVAFLDVIACGFGAIVLLVLILPVGEYETPTSSGAIDTLGQLKRELQRVQIFSSEKRLEIASVRAQFEAMNDFKTLPNSDEELLIKIKDIKTELKVTKDRVNRGRGLLQVQAMNSGIEDSGVQSQLYGVPVDSDYLAIVVDTSGSMQNIWSRVTKVIEEVLTNYPDLLGYQVLSDQGAFLSGTEQKWLMPKKKNIRSTVAKLKSWTTYSNSSPVEGVRVAVSNLYEPGIKMGLFVLGDDYTGTDFDSFLAEIDGITSAVGRKGQLRIHSLGFFNDEYTQNPERFGRLMQVLTFNHGGAFLYIGNEKPAAITISRNRRIPVAD